jgi:hypothetical protein
MDTWLDGGAAVFALIAATFWLVSAYHKPPPMAPPHGDKTPESDPFDSAARFSAIMNRFAFLFSGLSALCMGIKPFLR